MQQLKQGDWVRCGAYVFKFNPWTKRDILYAGHQYDDGVEIRAEDCTLWIPEPGEWCWFFNNDRIPTISQFVEINEDMNRKYFAVYPNKPHALGSWYTHCEQFIGELPSNLKDQTR